MWRTDQRKLREVRATAVKTAAARWRGCAHDLPAESATRGLAGAALVDRVSGSQVEPRRPDEAWPSSDVRRVIRVQNTD